jgi:protein SCO1/2
MAVAAGAAIGLSFAAAAIWIRARTEPVPPAPVAAATWAPGERAAPAIALTDQDGATGVLESLRGRVVLLTFLDSQCRQLCPAAASTLAQVSGSLGDEAPVLVAVSVNPADTPETAREAATRWGWDGIDWRWLMGDVADLERTWSDYGIDVQEVGGVIAHGYALYVIDAAGDQRAGFAAPFDPDEVTRTVLAL